MAAPAGHIFCALVFLNSGISDIKDKNALLVGTSFPDIRNVTYRTSDGRFCLIDFELATILPDSQTVPMK